MELSGLNPQDKHGRLTPPLASGRPQMLTSTVGAHGLPCPSSTSPSILDSTSQETVSPPLLSTYEVSKLLSGLAINL